MQQLRIYGHHLRTYSEAHLLYLRRRWAVFFKFSRTLLYVLAGLLGANSTFAQQSFHHTLAPMERVRVQQHRALRSQPGGATAVRAAVAAKATVSAKAKPAPVNVLNQRFLGWNHRVADPTAYRQRFSRAHAATTPVQAANHGTVALTANAVMRASVMKLALGASSAPSSVPGLLTRPSLLAGFI